MEGHKNSRCKNLLRMSLSFSLLFLGNTVLADSPLSKEGEFIIKIRTEAQKNPKALQKVQGLHEKLGAQSRSPFQIFHQFQVVSLPKGSDMAQAMKQYASADEIEYVEPQYIYRAFSSTIQDPLFKEQWALHNTGQRNGKKGADIGALEAWPLLQNNREIVVAVIDTGIDYTHPDLQGRFWTNDGEIPKNGVDDDGNGFVDDYYGYNFYDKHGDPKDDHMHGTHCAGIIAALPNEIGTRGVAPFVKLMPVKFLGPFGDGVLEDGILAIEYALKQGAHIMNNSWGGPPYSKALDEVVKEVSRRGVLFVAAAGNDHSNNDTEPTYPASYKHPTVLSVGATSPNDEIAPFSNWGTENVHLLAPGHFILSTVIGEQYKTASGTSMAAPMVAGAAAALMAHDPSLDAQQVMERLMSSVEKTENFQDKALSGGRLQLHRALLGEVSPPPTIDPDWIKVPYHVASPHPYPDLANMKWVIEQPGAKFIKVHFRKLETEKRTDYVALKDRQGMVIESLSGNQGTLWSRVIPGDKVEIQIRSDSINGFFGFEVDAYSYK